MSNANEKTPANAGATKGPWLAHQRVATGRPFQIYCYVIRRDVSPVETRHACKRGYHMSHNATRTKPRIYGMKAAVACSERAAARLNARSALAAAKGGA